MLNSVTLQLLSLTLHFCFRLLTSALGPSPGHELSQSWQITQYIRAKRWQCCHKSRRSARIVTNDGALDPRPNKEVALPLLHPDPGSEDARLEVQINVQTPDRGPLRLKASVMKIGSHLRAGSTFSSTGVELSRGRRLLSSNLSYDVLSLAARVAESTRLD